ncbi:MAG: Omp28-related outer membrane protein [Flavobacteriaceae bacterium]|nr:Omp28-related outer membrane protein [Flavobacteriaceae bacterium]
MTNKLSAIAISLFILLNLLSCGTEEEIVPDTLTISTSSNLVYIGNEISFTAVSQNTGIVTSDATFYVNGEEIDGNSFTPTIAQQDNTAYATWNGFTSNTIEFASEPRETIPDTYTRKVLFEDYTGTWCGYCPGMNNIIQHFTNYSNNVIPVAIHCDSDPYRYEFQAQLQEAYGTTGLPRAQINRVYPFQFAVENHFTDTCGTNQTHYEAMIQEYLDQPAPLGIAINSQMNANRIQFQVKVGFVVNQITNAKLVVYLLEDGLIYSQENYFSGNGNAACNYSTYPVRIPNYEHNHVLRKAYTHIFGDEIPPQFIANQGIYTQDFNVAIPSAVENNNKLSLVAFVLGNDNNEVINAQYVKVGQSQDFD